MKRSTAVIRLQKHYAIRHVMLESGYITVKEFCDEILQIVEHLGMAPPGYWKPIPFESDGKQYPLVPGDFKIDGLWCTPDRKEWEPE